MTVLDTLITAATHLAAIVPADIPNPDPVQPPGTEGVTTIMSWLKWIGYAVVGGAIIVGGILIAVSFRRGEGHDSLPKVLWPMAGAIVIGAGAAWIGTIAGG
ncbi:MULTISPECIES: hypothetical protein [Microbacteriaceae]|uniref:Conjugal transfer protein TrbC n=1 Tax=Microbacterium soli TaxID=446075 RepID=A0ABP7NLQ3_9MICO|nr:hypothetical protein [Agromyces sp. NBRC 114283]GLU91540.1 hypothetical protein Agsp01_37950 [Agromyces sp. NBRC 114283]